MGEFDTIRPYNDSEVPAVLARLFSDKAFLDILTHFRFPRFAGALGWLLKPMIARKLRREFAGVTTETDLDIDAGLCGEVVKNIWRRSE